MVCGRFLLLLPKRSRLQSFFSEKKASELASSKGWTVVRQKCQHLVCVVVGGLAHTGILLLEALGVCLSQRVQVGESILGLGRVSALWPLVVLEECIATYDLAARGAAQDEGRLGVLNGLGRPLLESALRASIPGFSGEVNVRF